MTNNIVFVPGNFQIGTQWKIIVGRSVNDVEVKSVEISANYWHVRFQVKQNGNDTITHYHFYVYKDGTIKGVALPFEVCSPELASTFSGSVNNGIQSHPPYIPQLMGKWGVSDDVRIERTY